MSDDPDKQEQQPTWRPMTPEEQEAFKKAYRPYAELPSIDITYNKPAEPTAEQIIANYYMRRGRNKKLSLRQHIKDSGTTLSEGYIRKVKVAYDKRHKARKKR